MCSAGGLELLGGPLRSDVERRGLATLSRLRHVLAHLPVLREGWLVPVLSLSREDVVADDPLGAELDEEVVDLRRVLASECLGLAAVAVDERPDVVEQQRPDGRLPVVALADHEDALAQLVVEQVGRGLEILLDVAGSDGLDGSAVQVVQQAGVGGRGEPLGAVIAHGALLGLLGALGAVGLGAGSLLAGHDIFQSVGVRVHLGR